MSPRRSDLWATLLWSYFEPQIATGQPLYLAADVSLIRDLLEHDTGKETRIEEAAYDFHSSCQELLEGSFRRAAIKDIAFQKIPGQPFSRVICLAIQQVLVVENMLNDNLYSENSYFPRYREVIDVTADNEHSNPLSTGNFQSIWDTLELEILATAGAAANTITFFTGSGKDLNRMLPFSQALLTTHDLTIIKERAKKLTPESDENAVILLLYACRNHFGTRAQRLISHANGSLRTRLYRQVVSFLANCEALSTIRPRAVRHASGGTVEAYLDAADFFDSDSYSVFLRTNEGHAESTVLRARLDELLERRLGLLLVPQGDKYRELARDEAPAEGEPALALVKANKGAEWVTTAARLGAAFANASSNLPAAFKLLACYFMPGNAAAALVSPFAKAPNQVGFELKGGILADARVRIYLAGYPPTSLSRQSKILSPGCPVEVGGTLTTVETLLNELKDQRQFKHYSVRIGSDKIDFAISPHSQNKAYAETIGYQLRGSVFELSTSLIAEGAAALVGTGLSGRESAPDMRSSGFLSRPELIALMGKGRRAAIDANTAEKLFSRLRACCVDDKPLAKYLEHKIASTRSIPVTALALGSHKLFRRRS